MIYYFLRYFLIFHLYVKEFFKDMESKNYEMNLKLLKIRMTHKIKLKISNFQNLTLYKKIGRKNLIKFSTKN